MKTVILGVLLFPLLIHADWQSNAPREEISPVFEKQNDQLILRSQGNVGTNGHWFQTFPVEGGKTYEFTAQRKAEDIEVPRRSCVVRIEWQGENGRPATSPEPVNSEYFGKTKTNAQPEFPVDEGDTSGEWVTVRGNWTAPEDAISAKVKLILRWTENGKLTWKDVSFGLAEADPERKVVLAAVHHNMPGRRQSPAENRELFVPLIEQAAEKGADLIVLPELLTCKGVTHDYASVAESIPGPTTDFFGKLSAKHDCYIVSGLTEREGKLVYNVAVLTGPDGKITGKYRKVTLPREEIERGISPGNEYPVFETRFGKVGMMICYDVFFPEVARELAANGAEVIAIPIWGGNPLLAAARCAENGVYLVTSTYTDHNARWMKTAIWDREGNRVVEADTWGTVVTAEVDLNQRTYWHGLGDFQARIAREAPVRRSETGE